VVALLPDRTPDGWYAAGLTQLGYPNLE